MFIYQTNRKGKISPLKLPLSRGIFLNSIRLVCYETGCGSEMGPWPSPSYSQKSDSVIIFFRTRAPDLCTPLDLLTKHFLLSPHKNHLRKGKLINARSEISSCCSHSGCERHRNPNVSWWGSVFMWLTWNGCGQSTAHCSGHTHVRDRQDQTVRDWKYPNCLEAVGTVERGTTGFHLGSLFWGLWYFPILSTFPQCVLWISRLFFLLFFYFHDCTADTARACRCWPQLWLQPSNCLAHQTTELPVVLRPCHSRLHGLSFNPQPGLSVYARLPFPSSPLGVISSFQPPCFS